MIKVGVIGYGYWGPNVARNFNLAGVSEVVAIADKSDKSQKRAAEAFPQEEQPMPKRFRPFVFAAALAFLLAPGAPGS